MPFIFMYLFIFLLVVLGERFDEEMVVLMQVRAGCECGKGCGCSYAQEIAAFGA